MITRKQSIKNFIAATNALIESDCVTSRAKIAELLEIIASSKTLVGIFGYCTEDFDYEKVFGESFVKVGDEGRFVLPADSKSIVALTLLVLCDVHEDKISLVDLVMTYFNEGTITNSYRRFAAELLTPFKDEVTKTAGCLLGVDIFSGGTDKEEIPQRAPAHTPMSAYAHASATIPAPATMAANAPAMAKGESSGKEIKREMERVKEKTPQKNAAKSAGETGKHQPQQLQMVFPESENAAKIQSDVLVSIRKLIEESRKIILQYKLNDKAKSELIALYGHFSLALDSGEIGAIRLGYLGYKYCTLYYRKTDSAVERIQQLLSSCGILP